MDLPLPYELSQPENWQIPIIISAPHVGTELPLAIKERLLPKMARQLPDTDWFVDQLYDFSAAIGAVLIKARYSRYVIDLNRPVEGPSLYTDSRRQTAVIPRSSFAGEDLYPPDFDLSAEEREERIKLYYRPYYAALHQQIERALAKFGKVLLWDAHSITRQVPSVQVDPLPDLMLGDRDGQSAEASLVAIALRELQASSYTVAYNSPFKGGQITRFHGHSAKGVYAMQLEMSQDIYMSEGLLDPVKTAVLQPVLQRTLNAVAKGLANL